MSDEPSIDQIRDTWLQTLDSRTKDQAAELASFRAALLIMFVVIAIAAGAAAGATIPAPKGDRVTNIGKFLTFLVVAAIFVLIVTHPAGFAGDAAVGGSVLTNTLNIESGHGVTSGTKGTVSYGSTQATFG